MKIQDFLETKRDVREFIETGDEYSFEFQATDDESITVRIVHGGREHLPGLHVSDDDGEVQFCYNPSIDEDNEGANFDFFINNLDVRIGDLPSKQNICTTISKKKLDRYITYLSDALFCANRDGSEATIGLSDKLVAQITAGEFVR